MPQTPCDGASPRPIFAVPSSTRSPRAPRPPASSRRPHPRLSRATARSCGVPENVPPRRLAPDHPGSTRHDHADDVADARRPAEVRAQRQLLPRDRDAQVRHELPARFGARQDHRLQQVPAFAGRRSRRRRRRRDRHRGADRGGRCDGGRQDRPGGRARPRDRVQGGARLRRLRRSAGREDRKARASSPPPASSRATPPDPSGLRLHPTILGPRRQPAGAFGIQGPPPWHP